MKLVLIVGFTVLAFALGAPVEEQQSRISGEGGWYVPQADGSFEWVAVEDAQRLLEDAVKEDAEKRFFGKSSTVVNFFLYTKSNPILFQSLSATRESIEASNFNAAHPTRFVMHGWGGSYKDDINVKIRDAWLSQGEYNIIVVDWSSRAQSMNYVSSAGYVPAVGKTIAELVDFLHKDFKMSFESLTLIGHSLGAHVAGFVGKNVINGRVHTIIGLDPALPLFSFDKPSQRLSQNDAHYVESIQTNGGKLGFLKPIGKGAFYPNGGKSQPGCGLDATGACAHSRSWIYYSEAVRKNDFPAMKCPNYTDAVSKVCGATFSSVRMGALTNAYMATGDFFVPVNKKEPYGKGV